MSQFVNDIQGIRVTPPINIDECLNADVGKYDLILYMAQQSKRIQKSRLIESKSNMDSKKYPEGPVLTAMRLASTTYHYD